MAKRPKKYATELERLVDQTQRLPPARRDFVIALVRSLIRMFGGGEDPYDAPRDAESDARRDRPH